MKTRRFVDRFVHSPGKVAWTLALAFLFGVQPSFATVDGGQNARLLGTTSDGRFAVIAEESVQESCEYEACVVYAVDMTQREFLRKHIVRLPPRATELKGELCDQPKSAECSKKVSGQLLAEDAERVRTGDRVSGLLSRYRQALRFWQRTLLGSLDPPGSPKVLSSPEGWDPGSSQLTLPEAKPSPLHLALVERWNVASFRSTTDKDEHCDPGRLKICHQEERWQDGVKSLKWVCPAPPAPQTSTGEQSGPKSAPDCSGRASMIRVEGWFEENKRSLGRSNLVEPGALMQSAVGLIRDRRVRVEDLQMPKHLLSVYEFAHTTLVVGAFGHGLGANGTWFPLVVAVPH